MIISSTFDYRRAARRRLPPFLFHYIDGGAYSEETMRRNCTDLQALSLRQRILMQVGEVDLSVKLFDQMLDMPVVLAPVGLTGMYARRGEVQAARAALKKGIPFTLSSVSVCPIEEVQEKVESAFWFQLYVLKDHGFMRDVLERSWFAGVRTLVFTVDMPVPGARYRDAHSGMSGPYAGIRRILQAMCHPHWAWNVGIMGRPHDLGNVSTYLKNRVTLEDYIGWLGANFDPSIGWSDLQWIRDFWKGKMILKGILDPQDAREAVRFGADGIVVSNHGGRQLDGVLSTTKVLPVIADAVKGDLTILADSGVRSGLDVVRMIAQGADAVMIGRAFIYALAAAGENGVEHLLDLFANEMRVAMTLTGVRTIRDITRESLAGVDAVGSLMNNV
ncbi:FMN-dependent L-lactate dehydrogenase LldD [Bartonella sp. B41]